MTLRMPPARADAKGNPAVRSDSEKDKSLALKRELLRAALAEHPAWTHEAIVARMREHEVFIDPPYFSKMLTGDKPIGLKHLNALPDEIEASYLRLLAQHFGLLVVERVDDADARLHFATGLFNLLAPTGSVPARVPLKANLRSARKAEIA